MLGQQLGHGGITALPDSRSIAMQQEPQDDSQSTEDADDIQEIYADLRIDSSLYTATLAFGQLRRDQPPLHRVRIRVSPHMLKAISLLTRKHVRDFEERTGGPILLPNEVVHRWGLEEEIR